MIASKLNGTEVYSGWEEYYQKADAGRAWAGEPDPAVSKILDAHRGREGLRVLDLGCGEGRNLIPWLDFAGVVGVDIAQTALARVRDAADAQKKKYRPFLLCEDMSAIPLIDSQFHVVQCFDALSQVIDPVPAMREMARLVSSDGIVYFNLFTPGDVAFGEGEPEGENSFVYRKTLFRFFEEEEIRGLVPKGLQIKKLERRTWIDPPHGPFRPETHRHEAIVCFCHRRVVE